MNTPRPRAVEVLTIASLVVAASLAAAAAVRLHNQASNTTAARAQYHDVAQRVANVQRLRQRTRASPIAIGEPPDAVSMVVDALSDAGVPSDRFRAHRQESDRPLTTADATQSADQTTARIRSIRVEIEPLSLPEFGRFLQAWRRQARTAAPTGSPSWVITRVALEHRGRDQRAPAAFAAGLTITTTYLQETP